MNERIEGTILIDTDHPSCTGAFAGTTLPDVHDVRVGFAGEIEYAATGEKPHRIWWFAGAGNFHEDWTDRENAMAVGWL